MLCEKFSITDYALRKGFKQNFGLNVGEYTRVHKIKTAARLLNYKDYLVSTVAECVGFHNQVDLRRHFKLLWCESKRLPQGL